MPSGNQTSSPSDSGRSHKANTSEGGSEPSIQLLIGGAGCASCVGKIESALNGVPGVSHAQMNFADRSATVKGECDAKALINAVESIGYEASCVEGHTLDADSSQREQADLAHYRQLLRDTFLGLGLGIPLMAYGLLGGSMTVDSPKQQLAWFIVALLCFALMLTAGRRFYLGAWRSLIHKSATMDTLVALGTGAAWLYSMLVVLMPGAFPELARHIYFEASAMIIGLINFGLALEARARRHTGEALNSLIGLQAKTARKIEGERETDVPIAEIKLGDHIRIRPGERVAIDGVVVEGQTTIDESMLTGEPLPYAKAPGDKVVAGSINKTGSIVAEVNALGEKTALANIIRLVKQAQNAKPSIGRLADRVSSFFVPAVVVIAIITVAFWLYWGPSPALAHALVAATSVLIIACPCALGLATPMSIMVGVGKAAEYGILIRKGEALQLSASIKTMVFDKTGTITLGEPKVSKVISAPNSSDDALLAAALSVERASEHPLAEAIVEYAEHNGLTAEPLTKFNAVPGKGVVASIGSKSVLLGNQALMDANDVALRLGGENDFIEISRQLASEAMTPIFVAIDKHLAGIIAISDPIKPDSIGAIQRLKKMGIKAIMLTGDNALTAKAVAAKVGIDQFYAEVLPDQKARLLNEFQTEGTVVGMVGDGINDAPALATANVGFAIGTGTDVAIESADITLMRGSLNGLVDAIVLSRAIMRNIKQNLFGAFFYNTLGIPVAAGVFYPLFGLLLNPVVAGAAMALSSVTVVSNANRLRIFKPKIS
jgi:Cu+-exporting ATPase